jgi:hypothetical protein
LPGDEREKMQNSKSQSKNYLNTHEDKKILLSIESRVLEELFGRRAAITSAKPHEVHVSTAKESKRSCAYHVDKVDTRRKVRLVVKEEENNAESPQNHKGGFVIRVISLQGNEGDKPLFDHVSETVEGTCHLQDATKHAKNKVTSGSQLHERSINHSHMMDEKGSISEQTLDENLHSCGGFPRLGFRIALRVRIKVYYKPDPANTHVDKVD